MHVLRPPVATISGAQGHMNAGFWLRIGFLIGLLDHSCCAALAAKAHLGFLCLDSLLSQPSSIGVLPTLHEVARPAEVQEVTVLSCRMHQFPLRPQTIRCPHSLRLGMRVRRMHLDYAHHQDRRPATQLPCHKQPSSPAAQPSRHLRHNISPTAQLARHQQHSPTAHSPRSWKV